MKVGLAWGNVRSALTAIVLTGWVVFAASCASTAMKPPESLVSSPSLAAAPVALQPVPQPPADKPPTGSIWKESGRSLVQDIKAHKVGDIVTITVSEKSEASKQATTTTGRTKDFSADFKFQGLNVGDAVALDSLKTGYTGKFDNNFKGSGVTSKTDSMTAYMTATVVDVLPNGNLLIRGSRWTKVNEELQQIILEGIVRPIDINRKNQILSQNISDAKIFFVGKGPVTVQQKPGWLGQLFDVINPF
jgi:flagellar L-ring protein precursor FlgH